MEKNIFYRGFYIDFLEKESKYELLTFSEERVGLFSTIDNAKKHVDEIIKNYKK